MKANIKKELHNQTILELRRQLVEAREALRSLRLDKEMGKLKNTSELREKRLEIAVISTIIVEKAAVEKLAGLEKEAEGKQEVLNEEKSVTAKTRKKSASAPSAAKAMDGKKAKVSEEGGKK